MTLKQTALLIRCLMSCRVGQKIPKGEGQQDDITLLAIHFKSDQ
jgi:hypothetical protein